VKLKLYSALSNEAHGDDQIVVFQAEDFYIAMVADGVTECEFGRVASVLTLSVLEEFFKSWIASKSIADVEEAILNGINLAAKRLAEAKKILLELRESGAEAVAKDVKSFVEKWRNLESTPSELIDKRVSEIRSRLLDAVNRGEEVSFETTLGIAIFHRYKVCTAALGDVEMYLLRRGKLFPHYVSPKASLIDSYLSSDKGVVGSVDLMCRRLEKGDTFIVATDGALLSYAPPGRAPYALFLNTVLKSFRNGEDPAQQWSSKLRSVMGEKLLDDFSLVIAVVE